MTPDDDGPIQDLTPLLIDVQQNLESELSLRSLAQRYGYSPFHFHRFFSSAIGETPKRHVDRLRLERAAYKLAITDESVLDIALSVGFNAHETFSRAFKRAFGHTPKDYRRHCKAAQEEWSKHNHGSRGSGCLLSDVRFVSLPPMTLLAVRYHGAYAKLPVPFSDDDTLWKPMLPALKPDDPPRQALLICYDDPTVTPDALQRCDACIASTPGASTTDPARRLGFAGGMYGGIEHVGPLATIEQAYWICADGIRWSGKYAFDVGPPLQIYRRIHIGGNPSANVSEVYFPIRRAT